MSMFPLLTLKRALQRGALLGWYWPIRGAHAACVQSYTQCACHPARGRCRCRCTTAGRHFYLYHAPTSLIAANKRDCLPDRLLLSTGASFANSYRLRLMGTLTARSVMHERMGNCSGLRHKYRRGSF